MSEPCSIFPVASLDRKVSRWEDRLHELTPVEYFAGLHFKRDECFAPLGYGGINGGKVRQLLYLVGNYLRAEPAEPGLILAASVQSPQIGRVAAIAAYYDIPLRLVIGTNPDKALRRHVNVKIARALGAEFTIAPVAYNPVLQKVARDVARAHPGSYLLEYGLSVEGSAERVESFYRFCGEQLANVPDVETLLLPAGSYNTVVALLYALACQRGRFKKLRNVVVFGIAPPRINWMERRLLALGETSGQEVLGYFRRRYYHAPEYAPLGRNDGDVAVHHFDLHASKFARWGDLMPASYADAGHTLVLHPNYEGKIARYMRLFRLKLEPFLRDACFWVVGIEPRAAVMERFL